MGKLVDEGNIEKCSVCHRVVLQLVPLSDNGSGKKMCRKCKQEFKVKEQLSKRVAPF